MASNPEAGAAAHRADSGPGWAERLRGIGPVAGLVLLCIAGTLLNGDFATLDNAMNVLTRTAFIALSSVAKSPLSRVPAMHSSTSPAT
ncbi:MAG: hypothetical protein EOP73_24825, partial [Variovorax sp.]